MLRGCLRYICGRSQSVSFVGCMPRRLSHVLLIALKLALPALLLSLSSGYSHCLTHKPEPEVRPDSDPDSMVVKFVCLACEERNGTPNFFTSFRAARTHYSRSPLCNMSPRGIATVVLPNRPTDNEAGGSGAAGQWAGQGNRGVRALPQQRQGMRYR